MNVLSQGVLTDNLIVMGGPHVFSGKLLRLLRDQGVDNVDAYPCTVRNLVTGEVHDDYFAANVLGKISCIDRSKSSLVEAGQPDRLLGFEHITLDEEQIRGALFFLLAEMPVQMVLHRASRAGARGRHRDALR